MFWVRFVLFLLWDLGCFERYLNQYSKMMLKGILTMTTCNFHAIFMIFSLNDVVASEYGEV